MKTCERRITQGIQPSAMARITPASGAISQYLVRGKHLQRRGMNKNGNRYSGLENMLKNITKNVSNKVDFVDEELNLW